MITYHIPVLVNDLIDSLGITAGKIYIDATVGGGGHAWEIIRRGGVLLGIDADSDARNAADTYIRAMCEKSGIPGKWKIASGNFRDIEHIAIEQGFLNVDGIVMDLGVSSKQLDMPEKGFSYRSPDAVLDMRFDRKSGRTAEEILRVSSEEEVYEIFSRYGEEEHSRAIARALIRARTVRPIKTAGDMIAVLVSAGIREQERFSVLSRIFQSLRIAVNDEMESLKSGLAGAQKLIAPGGVLAVISFHSLEDRIVKQFMRGKDWILKTKKPITASDEERFQNVRSRSAKLRIAEKL